ADAGTVERQRAAENLRVDPADRLKEAQVRGAQPLFRGDLGQNGSARVADLVHRVAKAGDELPRGPGLLDRCQRELIEARLISGYRVRLGQGGRQELPAVLGHAEEPAAAAEQPGGD